ncbi:MAG TPA: hypothetical protein PKJ37_12570 [Acidobacteriota bacterium]|nr:hypothetical protein [Acidobacteriota bacterium]
MNIRFRAKLYDDSGKLQEGAGLYFIPGIKDTDPERWVIEESQHRSSIININSLEIGLRWSETDEWTWGKVEDLAFVHHGGLP